MRLFYKKNYAKPMLIAISLVMLSYGYSYLETKHNNGYQGVASKIVLASDPSDYGVEMNDVESYVKTLHNF